MSKKVATRAGVYFAVMQFLFATCWTVYVIYLPALAAKVGIDRGTVIWILMMDQAIFTLMDFGMGVVADRLGAAYVRLARLLLGISLVSCAAFVLLPFVGQWGAGLFIVLIVLWSATSSALRAPPMALIGRYAAVPDHPWLASLSFFGLGVAGALAPFLTVRLRNIDPAVPFVVATASLALVTLGLVWAARALAGARADSADNADNAEPKRVEGANGKATDGKPSGVIIGVFLIGALLVAIGFQLHSALNSAPQYLRFAKPADLEHLMPMFWVGFNLAIFPMGALTKRTGALTVLIGGGIVGALALLVAWQAGTLSTLVGAQVLAGAAWAAMLMSAMSAALAFGHTGREGRVSGALFALLAIATFARMGIVATQMNQNPEVSTMLPWLPVVAWVVAAAVFLAAWNKLRTSVAHEIAAALVGRR